jgi:exopolysaccharide biosynthesis polyprenyl glycosylphosphotransferase
MSTVDQHAVGAEYGRHAAASLPTDVTRPTRPFSVVRRIGPWRDALRRRMLAAADVVAVAVACGLAAAQTGDVSVVWSAAMLPLWLLLAKLYGLYDQDHRVLRHLTVDELPTLVAWAVTGAATHFVVVASLSDQGVTPSSALLFWGVLVVLATILRAAARATWRRIVPHERALLVGSGPLKTATLRKLELFEDIHVDCVDVIDDSILDGDAGFAGGAALEDAIGDRTDLDRVIVASTNVSERLIAEHVAFCRRRHLKLSVVPPARAMFGTAVHLHHIADLPMIEYSTWDTGRSSLLLKRLLDVMLAGTTLLVLAPVLLLIALVVRVTSRGPALFVQARGGLGGRPFRMYKFRTMVRDAEQRLAHLMVLDDLEDPMFKLRSDPRVTRVGAWLRRTSLDELPQLLNVLQGSMSLVGPRPEQLDLVRRYRPEHQFRLSVRPGMTGPMQVYGRGELRFDERLAVEREYVENLSLGRDIRLLLMTVATVFRGRGAY